MGRYFRIALLFAICDLSSADQQHLVCKTIQDVFGESGSSQSFNSPRTLQGPPGKIGPRGIQGRQGRPGSPARVDYDRINDAITEKVASVLDDMESRISVLERNVTEIKTPATRCQGRGGLYNRGKCYTIPHISSSSNMNYNEAVAECAKTDALLAEIHDRTQQQALQDFADSKMPSGLQYVYLYIGMELQSGTSTLLLRSGRQIPISQFQWDSGYPGGRSYKRMIFEVGNDGDSSVGLWNWVGTSDKNGVICEKSF